VLIIFAHPALERSRVHYRLLKVAKQVAGVTCRDLYQIYPDFMVDSKLEQGFLKEHEIILFQYPMYWYSSPALLKEWQDIVLEPGFAYGNGGNALAGKVFSSVISAGGSRAAYQLGGVNQFTIPELLRPLEQTAKLCQMHYVQPFMIHDANELSEAQIDAYAEHYRDLLTRLQTTDSPIQSLQRLDDLNDLIA
jgi:glutathione-regulated potassium-efflux system ancillary protein KefG